MGETTMIMQHDKVKDLQPREEIANKNFIQFNESNPCPSQTRKR